MSIRKPCSYELSFNLFITLTNFNFRIILVGLLEQIVISSILIFAKVYARAFTHEHQDALITEIAAKMVEDQFRLLVCSFSSRHFLDLTDHIRLSTRSPLCFVLILGIITPSNIDLALICL